jgi:hypothetical protein
VQDCRFQFKLLHPHCLILLHNSSLLGSRKSKMKKKWRTSGMWTVQNREKEMMKTNFTTNWIKIGRKKTTQRRTANSPGYCVCGGGQVVGGGARVCCVSGVRARPCQQRLVAEGWGLYYACWVCHCRSSLLFAGGGARAGGRRMRVRSVLSLPLPLLTPLCRRRRSCGRAPNACALWASRDESSWTGTGWGWRLLYGVGWAVSAE